MKRKKPEEAPDYQNILLKSEPDQQSPEPAVTPALPLEEIKVVRRRTTRKEPYSPEPFVDSRSNFLACNLIERSSMPRLDKRYESDPSLSPDDNGDGRTSFWFKLLMNR